MSAIIDKIRGAGVAHELLAPTLEVKEVSVAYAPGANSQAVRASRLPAEPGWTLENISFQVTAGQHIAVVGPNGAGKSTLFKVIVGTLKPNQGSVKLFGHDPDFHICIAYVPQRNQIDWSFPVTVEDVVMMGRVGQIGLFRWARRRDWELVRASLDRVQLGHLAGKQIGELSGGQQQRAFLARALAQGADLLLMDEPLSGLDVPSRERILSILDDLRGDGVTLMVSTHDLDLASEHFDQIMLLNRRVIAFGSPTAVLTTENLLQAYGGHMHRLGSENDILVTDTCCDEGVFNDQ